MLGARMLTEGPRTDAIRSMAFNTMLSQERCNFPDVRGRLLSAGKSEKATVGFRRRRRDRLVPDKLIQGLFEVTVLRRRPFRSFSILIIDHAPVKHMPVFRAECDHLGGSLNVKSQRDV